ncbi:MAG: hypothetical protein ACREAA_08620 [Candidatus Polarisedimenticolia bacterium]
MTAQPQPMRQASPQSFTSQCLTEFLGRLSRIDPHPTVLDLGVLCGSNIAFLGSRGCRVSVESLPAATRPATPSDEASKAVKPEAKPQAKGPVKHGAAGAARKRLPIDTVLPKTGAGVPQKPLPIDSDGLPEDLFPKPAATVKEASSPLSYPNGSFSGILAWDAISRMPPLEAIGFVESLRKLLDEGGVILAYFPGPPGHTGGAAGRYRIHSEDKVEVEPAVERHVSAPAYQNREIYALFSRFEVIRLSHLKSGTREVLVAKSRRNARD